MSVDSPPEVPEHVLTYLQEHSAITIATASPSGVPHAATMVYVNDGPNLYFCTRPETTTVSHIEQNPVVSFTVDEYSTDWRKMKGIQGTGEAFVVLSASAVGEVMTLFQQKFPSLTDVRTRNISVFRIAPSSLQYIDNEQTSEERGVRSLAQDWRTTVAYNVFRELPTRDVEDVMGSLDSVHVKAGDIVVRQGAPADKFFIIADGEVEVIREDNGKTHTVATLKTGQFFGEMAILRDQPRTATIRASTPTTLLAMPGDVFRRLVAQSLSTTSDFDQLIQRRFSELEQLGNGA